MKCSFYLDFSLTTPEETKDVHHYLDRIKTGVVKDRIKEIREAPDKATKDYLKKKLSAVTFTGHFTSRSIAGLKKHSGLAILDFDGHDNVDELKEQISCVKYTYACWVSPSGNGVKVLVKIPPVDNNDDYKDYVLPLYDAYELHDYSDTGTSDISRLCFESYDPELFLNDNATIFTDKRNRKEIDTVGIQTNIPIVNQDEIANRLMVWFKKRWTGYNRNTNLHSLARQFNAFGVSKGTCVAYLLPFNQKDFRETEIRALINSAYKYSNEFNTQHFEDTISKKKIKNLVYSGTKEKEILKQFKEHDQDKIKAEIKTQAEEIDYDVFWDYDQNGKIKMNPYKFKNYIENKNIFKYYPSKEQGFTYIKKDDNFINEILTSEIKDLVLEDLDERGELQAWNLVAASEKTFKKDFLSMIGTAKIEITRDAKDYGIIYYKNKAVKIEKDSIELLDYKDLDGLIWENQVIDREVTLADTSDGEFRSFIWFISGQDKIKYFAFKSVIGYLLHSFKDNSLNKAVIFNDITVSENPNGGSGKGLFHKALGYIKQVSSVDGKSYDSKDRFRFQAVDVGAQVVQFDDVKRNFNFEDLFSVITEGFTIEKKGKDALFIPYEKSPKISITTNYTIKGEGGSHRRRKHEVEMSDYFNDTHSPYDEFGRSMFGDWNSEDWKMFDNYMIRALQYYLKYGLIDFPLTNLEYRKLQDSTNQDFIDWMDAKENIVNTRIVKTEFFNDFIAEYDEYERSKFVTKRAVLKWARGYAKYKGWKFIEGSSNSQRWFELVDKDKPKIHSDEDELPF
jgi:uncharacterized protein YuzE